MSVFRAKQAPVGTIFICRKLKEKNKVSVDILLTDISNTKKKTYPLFN